MSATTSPAALADLNIAVGGYDATVVGMHMSTDPSDNLLSLEARFAYAAHASSVRALAFHGPILASASSDETVRLYDVAAGTELAALTHHSGSVNCLDFVQDAISHRGVLLAGSEDCSISVTRDGDWRLLKKLAGHTAPVADVAIHPSGKVALSLASDRSLFMWNLVRGKVAFSAKTKGGAARAVTWSPSGERYMVTSGCVAAVYSAEGMIVANFEHEKEVLSAEFLDEVRVVTGGEDKTVRVWDSRGMKGKCVAEPAKHEMRVRGVAVGKGCVVSADTGGGVKVWDEARGELRIETQIGGGGMRLTCLAVGAEVAEEARSTEIRKAKGKRSQKEEMKAEAEAERAEFEAKKAGTASSRKRRKRKETVV